MGQMNKISNFFFRIINLYQEFILEENSNLFENNKNNSNNSHFNKKNVNYPLTNIKNKEHLFFILEDAQNFDSLSIQFLNKFISNEKNFNNISIIISHQTSLFFHTQDKGDKFASIPKSPQFLYNDDAHIFPMSNITNHEEISKIIKFSILKSHLGKNKKDKIAISKIEKTLLDIIISKSFRGNPLFIFEITESLLNSKIFIQHLSTEILVTSELLKMKEFQDWGDFKIPILIEKIVGATIDSLSLKEIILLKNASVIGNIFDINRLMELNPFTELNFDDVFEILQEQEKKGILEFLHDMNKKRLVCKFSIPFFRDILYQRMLVEQKNEVHLKVVSTFQKQDFAYYSHNKQVQILEEHLKNSERTLLVRLDEDESVEDFYSKLYSDNKNDGNLNKYAIRGEDTAKLNINNLKIFLVMNITNTLRQIENPTSGDNVNMNKNKMNMISGMIEKKSDKKITWER